MEAEDGELLAAEGASPSIEGIVLALRRVIYRCELLQNAEFSDGDRQALWESIVVALADIKQLDGCNRATHDVIVHERSRHGAQPGAMSVIPDGVSLEDLETGCLAPPYVDPKAARSLAEALIEQLTGR
ncbi:hypothetical protein GCM10022234_00960 [Aeromicrobium panaciterrae]|uniref:hypothetical protein n=1 Tax=Aeromicrobium panaciterrae TaxID=363861 RepID=UPI0031E0AC84